MKKIKSLLLTALLVTSTFTCAITASAATTPDSKQATVHLNDKTIDAINTTDPNGTTFNANVGDTIEVTVTASATPDAPKFMGIWVETYFNQSSSTSMERYANGNTFEFTDTYYSPNSPCKVTKPMDTLVIINPKALPSDKSSFTYTMSGAENVADFSGTNLLYSFTVKVKEASTSYMTTVVHNANFINEDNQTENDYKALGVKTSVKVVKQAEVTTTEPTTAPPATQDTPTEVTTEPTTEPIATESTVESTATEPTEVTTEPTEITTEPTEVTTEPTEPTTVPVDTTIATTEPTEATTEPSSAPVTEPTEKPTEESTTVIVTEPATEPTESTTSKVEETTQTEQTTAPVEPTTVPAPKPVPTEPATTVPTTNNEPTTSVVIKPAPQTTDTKSSTNDTAVKTITNKNTPSGTSSGAVATGQTIPVAMISLAVISGGILLIARKKRHS